MSVKPKLQLKRNYQKIMKMKQIMSQPIIHYDSEPLEQVVIKWLESHGYTVTLNWNLYEPHPPGSLVRTIGKDTINLSDLDQLLS